MDLKISIDDEVYDHFLNNNYTRNDVIAVHTALNNAESDIIRCKDCKHFERWRYEEKHGQLYSCGLLVISSPSPDDYCSKAERKKKEEEKNEQKP